MEINERIERMAELTHQMEGIQAELEQHKAFFEQQAYDKMKDTKKKTVVFAGMTGRVVVTQRASVQVNTPSALRKLLGDNYNDYIKTETKVSISKKDVSKALGAVYLEDYVTSTPQEVIDSVTSDGKEKAMLHKKLKGKDFIKDSDNLVKITGCSQKEAYDTAYLYAEAVAYDDFKRYTQLDFKQAASNLKAAVTVVETFSVKLIEY